MVKLLDHLGGVATEDLNATVMEWPRGHTTPAHRNSERDVLLVVLRGSAVVRVNGSDVPRRQGEALVIEKGAERQLIAGSEGARVLTAHLRRPGLAIQPRGHASIP
jgi:quercetin dioxygenase-like cupin family protein